MKFHKQNLLTEITIEEINSHKIWYNSKLTPNVDLSVYHKAVKSKDATLIVTTSINTWYDRNYYLSGGSDLVTDAKIILLKNFEKTVYQSQLETSSILTVDQIETLAMIKDKKLRNKFLRGLNPYHPINRFCLSALELVIPNFSYGLNSFNDHFISYGDFYSAYQNIDKSTISLEDIKPHLDFFLKHEIAKHTIFHCFEKPEIKYIWNTQQS